MNYKILDCILDFILVTIIVLAGCLLIIVSINKVIASDFKAGLIKNSGHVEENPCNECLQICNELKK